ncbi:MAG: YdcF family protein [Pseudomonadota bacterium]
MFFYLARIGGFLVQPTNALVLLLCVGVVLLLFGVMRARWLIVVAAFGLAIAGFSPLGQILIQPLEDRFPQAQEDAPAPDGIIMLGGAFTTIVSAGRGTVELNEAAERLTSFVALARRYPDARLVVTGGSAQILYDDVTETEAAIALLADLGIDPGRLELEDRARNTYENALYTRDLVRPAPDERWLVVTSAFHIPRAVGCFRAVGFEVDAFPVDYRTRGRADRSRPFYSASEGLKRTDRATREWIGLAVYWLTGRTNAFLPAPIGVSLSPS